MICLEGEDEESQSHHDPYHQRCCKALKVPLPKTGTKRGKKLPICFPLHQSALFHAKFTLPNAIDIQQASVEVKRELFFKSDSGCSIMRKTLPDAVLQKLIFQRARYYAGLRQSSNKIRTQQVAVP